MVCFLTLLVGSGLNYGELKPLASSCWPVDFLLCLAGLLSSGEGRLGSGCLCGTKASSLLSDISICCLPIASE